jgi:hypothetical protein
MDKKSVNAVVIILLSMWLAGCAWKPDLAPVPITAPWSELNFPVKENAVVWTSEENRFSAVHKDDKKAVMEAYVETLKAQGWALGKFETDESGAYNVEVEKAGEKLSLRIYDFDNTGVIIEKLETAPVTSPQ